MGLKSLRKELKGLLNKMIAQELGCKEIKNNESKKDREAGINGLVKNYLINKEFLFYCLKCKKFLGKLAVKKASLRCDCKSKYITFFKNNEKRLINAFKQLIEKRLASKKEEKLINELKRRGDMYLSYGKMACYTLAAPGINANTGLRILSGFYKKEDDFIKSIIETKKEFKNKDYWEKKR